MTKHKNNRRDEATALRAGNRGVSIAVVSVVAVAIVASLGLWWWRANRTNESPGTPPPIETRAATTPRTNESPRTPLPIETTATATPAAAVAPKAEFQRLKGKWLRPDGGYVVEVRSVDAAGKMDASYSNPRRINVSKAEASQDGPAIKVFIELRDVNYPGSTYNLTYDPQSDQLKGIYYQAALQQQFEVFFVRMK
jgi:type IV secretory pathway VirB10-like protein